MLELLNVCKSYNSKNGRKQVLSNFSLSVNKGETVCISGKEGSGKTTLFNILSLMDNPNSGLYKFEKCRLDNLSEHASAKMRNRHFGLIFQSKGLLNDRTVIENLCIPALYAGELSREAYVTAYDSLMCLGLANLANCYPLQLSKEEQFLVACARSIINEPELIIADEPAEKLNIEAKVKAVNFFRNLHRKNCALIIFSNDEVFKSMSCKNISLDYCEQINEMRV